MLARLLKGLTPGGGEGGGRAVKASLAARRERKEGKPSGCSFVTVLPIGAESWRWSGCAVREGDKTKS